MQSNERNATLIWEAYKRTPEAPAVLAADDGNVRKYAEDPLHPEEEALKELSPRLNSIALLIMPPCSSATLKAILENSPGLKRIYLADSNEQRLQAWKNSSFLEEKLEILPLDANKESAYKKLKEKLNLFLVELFQGRSAVFIPRRFKRLDPGFADFLETSVLKIQKEACSSAAFKTTRSWHLTMNRLLNLRFNKAKTFIDKKEKVPFVIVGAGPSLGTNVKTLAKYSDRAIIISCDAALNALLENGIKPDLIASAEDLTVSWRFLAKHLNELKDIPLVLPLNANNLIVKNYPGELIFATEGNTPSWISEFSTALPRIDTGQCVGHFAHNIANFLNASEIIMVGFDLALKGEKYHCDSMSVPYFDDGSRFFELLEVEGVDGAMLKTDLGLYLHLEGFEKIIQDSPVATIDATEGGAKKKGAIIKSLEQALENKTPVPPLSLQENDRFNSINRLNFYSNLFASVKEIDKKIDKTEKETERMTADSASNPVSELQLESNGFEIVSSSCNFLLINKFAGAVNSFARENFNEFRDDLLAIQKELKNGVIFIEAIAGLLDFEATHEIYICLEPPENNYCREFIAQLPASAHTISSETPLPELWKKIQETKASTLIAFNGNVIPDAWSAPGIKCIDIKTNTEKQIFERSLWIPGYQLAGANESLLESWRDYLPLDIECKLFKDILNHG